MWPAILLQLTPCLSFYLPLLGWAYLDQIRVDLGLGEILLWVTNDMCAILGDCNAILFEFDSGMASE